MLEIFVDNPVGIGAFLFVGICILIIWKLIHYLSNKSSNTRAIEFLFFSEYSVDSSYENKRKLFKRRQNLLSRIILILLLIFVILEFIFPTNLTA